MTTHHLSRLLFVCLAWLAWPAWAQPDAVRLSQAQARQPLGLSLEVLEDREGRLTLEEVRSRPDADWRPSTDEVLNFSFSTSTWWVRGRVVNDTDGPATRVLEAASALQDELDLHLLREGRPVRSWHTGDRRALDSRDLVYRYPAFALTLAPGETASFIARLGSHDGLHEAVPFVLRTQRSFLDHVQRETMVFGAYYGGLLALLLYNLLLSAITRDRVFLLYAIYLGTYLLWNFTFLGYGQQHLWPDHPDFNNQVLALSIPAIFIALAVFSCNYLQTRQQAPRWHGAIVGLAALASLAVVPALLDRYALSILMALPAGGALLLVQLAAALHIAARGYRPARFYVLAWTALALGALATFLKVFGVLPSNVWTEYSLNIGSAIEFVLLALALADKMNTLKAEKLAVQRQAAVELERQVAERTHELAAANERLQQASITDELTGLYNRRYFNLIATRELNRCRREGRPLAMAMLDVDRFKAYNDRYGHSQGDQALAALARAMDSQVNRATDYLFRLGGEEFAVLLVGVGQEEARQHVERVRRAVSDLQLAHEGSERGVVTVSAGLVWRETLSDLSADQLYVLADEALYRAKAAGRDRLSE